MESTENKYNGLDNYGRPKSDYLNKIGGMSYDELLVEIQSMIYHSARCANNQRADWHWMVDACYDESVRRGSDIYDVAYERVRKELFG